MSDRTKIILELAANRLSDELEGTERVQRNINSQQSQKQINTTAAPYTSSSDSEDIESPFSSDDSVKDKNYDPSSADDPSSTSESETETDNYLSTGTGTRNNSGTTTPNSSSTINGGIDSTVWSDIEKYDLNFNLFKEQHTLKDGVVLEPNVKPIDIYKLFINDGLLDTIVTQTNIYAQQCLCKRHSRKSRIASWTDTNKYEIKKFLGVTLATGLTQVPAINLYWSKNSLYHNSFISSVFKRDRYLLLLSSLHFSNNEEVNPNTDNRLQKIDKVLTLLLKNFQEVLEPCRNLVIDETMVPFRGRLRFRQYIPNKSHKYGIKLYKLCTTNGYTYNVKVYVGRGDTQAELGHSHSIVLKLLEPVNPKEGRVLYADNFYSSISLTETLLTENMLYCGTLRINRRGVPKLFSEKMKKGEVLGKQKNNVRILKWVDKRPVLMITSIPTHDDTLTPTGRTNRIGQNVLKPKCVIDYNAAKKGVDLSDQMSSYHSILRKSLKWYRKLMFELLLGTAVVNSWIVYNMASNNKLGITEFRRQLADQLVSEEPEEEDSGSKTPKKKAHTFIKPEGEGRKRRRPCKGCYQELRKSMSSREADKKVRRIISYCQDCPDTPAFCLQCFNKHHQ